MLGSSSWALLGGKQSASMSRRQAEEGAPIKPGQAARDERGRVSLDDLSDADLDYGCDERGLASLRKRLRRAINSYDGAPAGNSHSMRAHVPATPSEGRSGPSSGGSVHVLVGSHGACW